MTEKIKNKPNKKPKKKMSVKRTAQLATNTQQNLPHFRQKQAASDHPPPFVTS